MEQLQAAVAAGAFKRKRDDAFADAAEAVHLVDAQAVAEAAAAAAAADVDVVGNAVSGNNHNGFHHDVQSMHHHQQQHQHQPLQLQHFEALRPTGNEHVSMMETTVMDAVDSVHSDLVSGGGDDGDAARARKRQYAFIPEGIKERAIVLVVQHKCSVSDVAEVMGVSRGALYKHIERARKQMDDASRGKSERRSMKRPAGGAVAAAALALPALQSGALQPSPQVKNLVAKVKGTLNKTGPVLHATNAPSTLSAADESAAIALVGGNAGMPKDIVL